LKKAGEEAKDKRFYNMLGFRGAFVEVHLVCRKGSAMEVMATNEGLRSLFQFNNWRYIFFNK